MVCSRGASLTHRMIQMKKFIFLFPLVIGVHINMQPVLANQNTVTSETWEEEYLSDPRWAKHYSENLEAASHSKANWEEVQAIKARGPKDGEECSRVAGNWKFD